LIAILAFILGKPSMMERAFDSDHRACGVNIFFEFFYKILILFFKKKTGEAEDYPLIYFVAPYETTLYRAVCVKECPHGFGSQAPLDY
jgi:hypothetical protein